MPNGFLVIVSHKHAFVFLHARKTAGTSIMTSLSRYLGPSDVCLGDVELSIQRGFLDVRPHQLLLEARPRDILLVSPAHRRRRIAAGAGKDSLWTAFRAEAYRRSAARTSGLASAHSTAAEIRNALGASAFERYFKFAFVRNPWERFASFFYWRTRLLPKRPAFPDFVAAVHGDDPAAIAAVNAAGYDNLPIYTIDGALAVDFIGRFEALQADLTAAASMIGLPFDGWLPKEKAGVTPRGLNLHDLYDSDTIRMVGEILEGEVSLFGYAYPH